jgi:uncharacterized protein YndB with AHSA1/START domain
MKQNFEVTTGILIDASPETVFAFLTEQDKAAQWFGEVVEIDGRAGGIFHVGIHSGPAVSGQFVEVIPHSKVVFTWGGVEGLAPGESTVEINLRPEAGGTRVTLHHFRVPHKVAIDSFSGGWNGRALPMLKKIAEGGDLGGERCFGSNSGCAAKAREAI